MKILIIIDETNFYHPMFLNDLLKKLNLRKYEIEVGLVTKIKNSNSLEKYLIKNINRLSLNEIIRLSSKKIFFSFLSLLNISDRYFFSVLSVLKKKKISFFKIKYDINTREHLDHIQNYKPDLIISSCSVIFGKELLNIPKLGSINRHSSLLPSYGGLFPVLHSIANHDNKFGVSINFMDEIIDNGSVISQKSFINNSKNLSKIYKICFGISSSLIIDAIDNLDQLKTLNVKYEKSYFTFPSVDIWKRFRENGGKFI